MKLFTEQIEDVKFIVEEKGGKKNLYIEGIYMQAEKVNGNGRKYRVETLQREVERYSNKYIKENRALGELGHPNGPSINLDRVSHKIVELKQNGNDFYGKALVLDTPMGNIARNLIESGVQLGVSTRGMGSLKEVNGIMEVQDDFYLATAADIVAEPSAPDAFVQGIMEGVEWVYNPAAGIWSPIQADRFAMQAESMKRTIQATPSARLEEVKVALMDRFFKSLTK
jgi:hypothetical protein